MDVYEITGYKTGVSKEGVNFLQPSDSFESISDGYIYRQVLYSRRGFSLFAPRLTNNTRITGIFEFIKSNGEVDLLATDQNFLYKYNNATGVFDQIAFGGSMAAYGGFAIGAVDQYISGTSYPDKNNGDRFVFTGEGIAVNGAGSAVFFYDSSAGTVKDYTALADNPDYVQPTIGPLVRAKHVLNFAERINFIVPETTGLTNNTLQQSITFSGIRDSAGTGDDFQTSGSGTIVLDTAQQIKGATILGQWILFTLTDSPWTLEKTTDPFNPYYPRKIPSVIGSSSNFVFPQWNGSVKTIGLQGITSTDGRQSVRIDNKIPFFTKDEIYPGSFDNIYGGFDRGTAQFLFTYSDATNEPATQDKMLTYNYEESSWSVYNIRASVIGNSDAGLNIPWDDIDETNNPSWAEWDTTEEIWDQIGLGAQVDKTLFGDNLGFIYQLNTDLDDYDVNITAISQASQAVLTVDASAFQAGDKVVVQSVEGMTEINNFDPETNPVDFIPYTVVSATPTAVTINVDSTDFTAYTTGGRLSKVIDFEARTIPFNPYRAQGNKCYISMVEILIDITGGYCYMDMYMDGETTPFKQNVLLNPTQTAKSRNWVEVGVNQEADFFTFVIRQCSPAVQYKQTSMRIHAMEGGPTYG